MAATPPPFAAFEWLIAWRYLRARRAEGGVSVMTWISLLGITLAVFALIATLSVRSGFRAEFVDTILGANAHATVYVAGEADAVTGRVDRTIADYEAMAERLRAVPGVRPGLSELAYRGADRERVEELFERLGWNRIYDRIPKWQS